MKMYVENLTPEEQMHARYLLNLSTTEDETIVVSELLKTEQGRTISEVIESELCEAYYRDTLTVEEREAFERLFLNNPARREVVATAQLFHGARRLLRS